MHSAWNLADGSNAWFQPSMALNAINTMVLTRNTTAMPIMGPPFHCD
jgi:hypothetical protein